jgi:cysteine-rich repeat protein
MRESMLRLSGLGLLIAAVTILSACGDDPAKESCGDGTLSANERCDDGNKVNGDGCSSSCDVETAASEDCAATGDEDSDGNADCADSDCAAEPACTATPEDCASVGDEDGDGNADCADSDCAAEPACAGTPEDCATVGDEDGDGDADCADSDCATADGCFEVCDDGVDNNGDDTVDCLDPTCSDAVVCESFCGDGVVDAGEGCDDGAANSDIDPDACRNNCEPAFCGDGVFDAGEQCDSGNANSDTEADACRTSCVLPSCGDGAVDFGEECDGGANASDTAADACRTSCKLPVCGDGAVDTGEGCDNGAENSDTTVDGCRTNCAVASCGDGVLDAGEACDNGAANSDTVAGACRTRCLLAGCGDGVLDAGEVCDNGAANSNTVANACRTTCTAATCGDGVVDAGETCDAAAANSNTVADACRTSCQLAACGDGVQDAGEACDAGALNGNGSTNPCRTACLLPGCGDGIVDAGEACDNGRANSDTAADACRTSCAVATCGDGILDSREACDSGAANSNTAADACRTSCSIASCGDGTVDTFELCDNGAANSDTAANGCRTTCAPASCGDGVVDTGEACDAGAANSDTAADGCRTSCDTATCGDGVIDAGEQCDDGAANGAISVCAGTCTINHALACGDADLRDPSLTDPPAGTRFLVSGNLNGASDDFAGGCGANPGVEEVVVFVAPTTGDFVARTAFLGTFADTSVRVLTDCGSVDSEIACGADGATAGDVRGETTFSAIAGRAYYILVEAEIGTQAPYLLEVAPVVASTAPVVATASARYLSATNIQVALTGSDAEQDVASIELYAVTTTAGEGSGSGAIPPSTERVLIGTFPRNNLSYNGTNGFSTNVELTAALDSTATGLEAVAIDAAGNRSAPFAIAAPVYTAPTTVASGATCDPTQQLTICTAPQACTRQSNATYICAAARAPSLASATVTRVDLTTASVRLTGFDTNADVTRFRAEFYTATNGRLGQIEGNLSATLLGQANYDVTFPLTGVNNFPTATQIRFVAIDQRGQVSNQLAAPLAGFADRTAGQLCDPAGVANRCATGLSCQPKQDGGTACIAPSAPVFTGFAASISELGLAVFGPVSGFDADGGLTNLRATWNFAGGSTSSEDYPLSGFSFRQSGSLAFEGAAPVSVTFTVSDSSGNQTVSSAVTVALPGDPGAACDRAGTACLANDYACGLGAFCETASAPVLSAFSFVRTDLDNGAAELTGSDDNGDIAQVRIDALDQTGGPIVGLGWLLNLSAMSDTTLSEIVDVIGIASLRNGTTISATLIDRAGLESNTITIPLPGIVGAGGDCSDAAVAICAAGLECAAGLCTEVNPFISSLTVSRTDSTTFTFGLTGGDPNGDATGFAYTVFGPTGATIASGETASPDDHADLGGSFDVAVTLTLVGIPNGSTIAIRAGDNAGHTSAIVTDALPLLVAIGGDCADDASIDACVTGAFCTVGICLTDAPVINSISANRTSLDAATVTLRVGDALSNVNGLVFTALNSRGDVLGTLASDTVAQDGPFSTFFKELTGLSAYPTAAAIGVEVLDATGNSTPTSASIPVAVLAGGACSTALDLCGGGTFCATVTGAPVCSSHAPAVPTITVSTAADLRTFSLAIEGFDADADITQLEVTYSLDGASAVTTTYTVTDGDFTQEADGTVLFTTDVRWDIVQMGQFDLISAKFTDAAALTGSGELAYGDFAPLVPNSDCDPAGRACGAGLFCDAGICAADSAAACGTGVDVAPIESGTSDGAGGYSLTGLVTPVSTAAALGDCGSDGDETAILFAVGSGDWNVVVSSPDAVFVTVVEGYCAISTPAVCEPTTGGLFSTVISASAETAKYLLVESATPGATATVSVTATPVNP